jgi:ABC-type uncharacterized transport system substrate-binding protein
MKHLLIFIVIVLSTIASAETDKTKKSIYIVLSSGDAIYYNIAESLENALSDSTLPPHNINIVTLESGNFKAITTQDLLIPIGAKAAEDVFRYQASNTIIYSFVEQELIQKLNPNKFSNKWAAVTVNQPIERLITVADKLVKKSYKNNIVIIVSRSNTDLIEKINAVNSLYKGQVELVEIQSNDIVNKRVEKSLFNAAALIATDEEVIWSGSNAKWLLRQAYNYQVPVVGNSRRFLKAGALISVYSSMEEISKSTSVLIKQWLKDGTLTGTGIHYVASTIGVNKSIANALHYKFKELKALKVHE